MNRTSIVGIRAIRRSKRVSQRVRHQRRWEDEFDTKPAPESRSVESKPVDLRIRMYNGSISARSSERESVEDNCKAYNRWMEELGEPHRDYNY